MGSTLVEMPGEHARLSRATVAPLVAMLVRHRRIGADEIVAALGEAEPSAALGLAREVATEVDDDGLRAIGRALANRGLFALGVGRELVRRGLGREALDAPPADPSPFFDLLGDALARAEGRDAWIEAGRARLRALGAIDEPLVASRDGEVFELRTLVVLSGVKHLAAHLASDEREPLLAHLESRVTAEGDAGEYDELDYPYGAVDPTLELARALATSGEPRRAEARLDERDARYPAFLNAEEIDEVVTTLAALGDRARMLWPKLAAWARRSDEGLGASNVRVFEAMWLVRGPAPAVAEPALFELLDAGAGAAALGEILLAPARSASLRDAARSRLVRQLVGDAEALCAGAGDDFDRMLRRSAVRAGATTAAAIAGDLSPDERASVARAASAWDEWMRGAGRAHDPLDSLQTAIGLHALSPAEVSTAVESLKARLPDHRLVRIAGWESIFSEGELQEMLSRFEAVARS